MESSDVVKKLEKAISCGCTESEAAAWAGITYREYEKILAEQVDSDPHWLNDLKAKEEAILGAARINLADEVMAGEISPLTVLERRDPKWKVKQDFTTDGKELPTPILANAISVYNGDRKDIGFVETSKEISSVKRIAQESDSDGTDGEQKLCRKEVFGRNVEEDERFTEENQPLGQNK